METRQTYLQSTRLPPHTPAQMLVLGLLGTFLTPPYLMLAWPQNVPGLHIRLKCLRLVLRLLLKRRGPIDLKMVSGLLFYPLDSTRYFEVDFVWRTLSDLPVGKYLDVSSPRLVFTLLLWRHHQLEADLINPDKADLAETERLLRASGLLPRSRLHNAVITQASLVPNSYDTITSVSVVEHIPDDRQAIKTIWDLLKPGGRFLLTVPCAAASSEQFIDTDEYGLYGGDKGTHVFWQRFYDPALLQERVFAITGRPVRQIIFGECEPGLFLRNATEKRTNRYYPFWREPYMVGQEYRYFDSVNELPGEGVIAMEFQKR